MFWSTLLFPTPYARSAWRGCLTPGRRGFLGSVVIVGLILGTPGLIYYIDLIAKGFPVALALAVHFSLTPFIICYFATVFLVGEAAWWAHIRDCSESPDGIALALTGRLRPLQVLGACLFALPTCLIAVWMGTLGRNINPDAANTNLLAAADAIVSCIVYPPVMMTLFAASGRRDFGSLACLLFLLPTQIMTILIAQVARGGTLLVDLSDFAGYHWIIAAMISYKVGFLWLASAAMAPLLGAWLDRREERT